MGLSMDPLSLSIVICAHNPRLDYLRQTIEGLRRQTLPASAWDLLVIDNASDPPLDGTCDLSWHPRARVIREEKLGITHARFRGIRETGENLIVFVDDDNVLCTDYLANTQRIAAAHPGLGAWGAGHISPRYEIPPKPELEPFCEQLALRVTDQDSWTHVPIRMPMTPYGAGLVLRRRVAEYHVKKSEGSALVLDRVGGSLSADGDTALALSATDLGMAYGIFTSLSVTHLIPARRVQLDYLLRLKEETVESNLLYALVRGTELGDDRFLDEMVRIVKVAVKIFLHPGLPGSFYYRELRGRLRAVQKYRSLLRKGIPKIATADPILS
jgi:glycosyltransferase involved in cell wall biosynthesis